MTLQIRGLKSFIFWEKLFGRHSVLPAKLHCHWSHCGCLLMSSPCESVPMCWFKVVPQLFTRLIWPDLYSSLLHQLLQQHWGVNRLQTGEGCGGVCILKSIKSSTVPATQCSELMHKKEDIHVLQKSCAFSECNMSFCHWEFTYNAAFR